METIKTISKIGNSFGVIIPTEMLRELNLEGKEQVRLTSLKGMIQIEPLEKRADRVLKAAAKYVQKYHEDFKKLAR